MSAKSFWLNFRDFLLAQPSGLRRSLWTVELYNPAGQPLPHSCAEPQDFSREHAVSSSRLLREIFNNVSPRTDPWCTKLLTKHQLDIKWFINILEKIELTDFQTIYLPFHSVSSCFVGGGINLQAINDRGHNEIITTAQPPHPSNSISCCFLLEIKGKCFVL